MKNTLAVILIFIFKVSLAQQKAPAYPLITHDPYYSIWSMTDTLNASSTRHWTGAEQSLLGMIKVDGKCYRVIGNESKNYKSILLHGIEKYTISEPGQNWQAELYDDKG